MNNLRPLAGALATSLALIFAGLIAIVLGARVVARTLNVYDQIPAMVSGGVAGLALVITGCALTHVQVGRACAESERRAHEQLLAAIATATEAEEPEVADDDEDEGDVAQVIALDDTREFRRITS